MVGPVIRIKSTLDFPVTESEVRLKDLKETVKGWEQSGFGIDEHPARAGTRMDTGQEITRLKRHLIETGLYRTAI